MPGPGLEHATAAGLMVAGILARRDGPVLWVSERNDLFAPALAQVGLSPDRVVHVAAPPGGSARHGGRAAPWQLRRHRR